MGGISRQGNCLILNEHFGLPQREDIMQCFPTANRGGTHSLTGILVQGRVSRQAQGKFMKIIFLWIL